MRQTSLAHLTVLDADPVALVMAGAAGGFDAVGLRIVAPLPGDRIVPVVGDRPLQRRLKEALRETGLRVLDVEAVWLRPETRVEVLLPALDLAAELGARHVLAVGRDPDGGRLRGNFARLCEEAHARGRRVMLESIPYAAAVPTLADAAGLLADVAPTDAGLLVDALHLSRSGGRPADVAAHDPALFSYVHLCDAPAAPPGSASPRAEARGGRLLPGQGGLRLDEFLDAFPPDTPVAVEAPWAGGTDLPPAERGRLAGEATRAFLARHDLPRKARAGGPPAAEEPPPRRRTGRQARGGRTHGES